MTSPSRAWSMSSALMKSGVLSLIGSSIPLNVTWRAPRWTPALSRTALSGTPFQRALPMAPLPNCPPATRGVTNPRLFPEHWFTATVSIASNCLSSCSESFVRLVDLALDLDGERVGIDVERDAGEVIAHEERVIRRDGAFVEHRERRLELGRTAGQPDHRALLRILDERPLAVLERHGHRIERQCLRCAECRPRAKRPDAGACPLDEFSSVEHGRSPDGVHLLRPSRAILASSDKITFV